MSEQTIAEIASKLTKAQRAALSCPPTWGLPAGHNQWYDLSYFHQDAQPDDPAICNGEDMDAVARLGLVSIGERDDEDGAHLVDDTRDVEACWRVDLTPLGIRVRAHLLSEGHDHDRE